MNKNSNHHWQIRAPNAAYTLPWNVESNIYILCHNYPIYKIYIQSPRKNHPLAAVDHG